MKLESTSPQPTPNLHQLPNLAVLLGQIEQQLMERGELGILSVTVIRRREGGQDENWEDYETILREISIFLERFSHQQLRSSDIVLAPILAVIALLSFIFTINDFVIAAAVLGQGSEDGFTLAIGLYRFVNAGFEKNWGAFAAGALMAGIPVIVLFQLLQRYIVSGLTQGGVKG